MGDNRVLVEGSTAPAFSIELPPGLIRADVADIENPPPVFTFASRIAAILAVNGPASITFSLTPAKGARSLTHVLQRAAKERGSSNPSIYFENIGAESHRHPGLSAEISVGCELALFEDGGTVVIMEASGTADIWSDYQPFLRAAMLSVELLSPTGPTLPLSPGGKIPELEGGIEDPRVTEARDRETELERKANEARKLIAAGNYDAAEALLAGRDAGPEVYALIGRLYEERLRDGGALKSSVRENLYRRALDCNLRAYPEPHTEIEANDYRRGMDEDRARLAELLGYDPGF
jgi:hypothetical protein